MTEVAVKPQIRERGPKTPTVSRTEEGKQTPTPTQQQLGNKIKAETATGTIDPHDIAAEIAGEKPQTNQDNQPEARTLEQRKKTLLWQFSDVASSTEVKLRGSSLASDADVIAEKIARADEMRGRKSESLLGRREHLATFLDALNHYKARHGLSEQAISGLANGLLPAIEKGDPQVSGLLNERVWSSTLKSFYQGRENFGMGDFIVKSYGTEITPMNINELLMVVRDVPTTNLARLEQNRIDAIHVDQARAFGGMLRDTIHNQVPGAHELLVAMVSYYDTGGSASLEEALRKIRWTTDPRNDLPQFFDRANYERSFGKKGLVKVIDILQRLAKNTEPVDEEPPTTSDQTFNEKVRTLKESKAGKTVSREALEETLDYVNSGLVDRMERGEIGIEPNQVLALGWLERQGHEVLQNMSYEDQLGAYRQSWFHSILRFQELTASPGKFDSAEFQNFIDRVSQADSDQTAYRLISTRTLDHVSRLGNKYKEGGRTYRAGALWSGNTAHELIGLTDPKPAITEQGKKHREEWLRRVIEPSFHPGD